jgi:hypothetical protein
MNRLREAQRERFLLWTEFSALRKKRLAYKETYEVPELSKINRDIDNLNCQRVKLEDELTRNNKEAIGNSDIKQLKEEFDALKYKEHLLDREIEQLEGNALKIEYNMKNGFYKITNLRFIYNQGQLTLDQFIEGLKHNGIQFVIMRELME